MRTWWHRALAARQRWRCRRGLHRWSVGVTHPDTKLAWLWICVAPGCRHVQGALPNYRREARVPWR